MIDSARNKQKFVDVANEEWNFKEFNESLKELKNAKNRPLRLRTIKEIEY